MSMKRLSAVLLTCAMLASVLVVPSASDNISTVAVAETSSELGLTYKVLSNGTIQITGYVEGITSAVIPETISGRTVTAIGNSAFEGCTTLTDITLPDTLSIIKSFAFDGCTALESIVIPDSVITIGSGALQNCTALTSVTLGKNVKYLYRWAFANDTALESVNIPESVIYADSYVFYNTPWLAAQQAEDPVVVINGNLIDASAVTGDLVIPEGVTRITSDAISNNKAITSVSIPASVTKIEADAFASTSALSSITVDAANTHYKSVNGVLLSKDGTTMLHYPQNNTEFVIPDTVTAIPDDAFNGYETMTSIVIPDSVTSIGNGAFSFCTALESITIPDSVTAIGDHNAEEDPETGEANGTFHYCQALSEVTLPAGLTRIEANTFYCCEALTEIDIPETVAFIGRDAFYSTGIMDSQTGNVKYADNWVIHIEGVTAELQDGTVGIAERVYSLIEEYDSELGEFVTPDPLMTLVIPDSVQIICDYAFYGYYTTDFSAKDLADITISDALAEDSAFALVQTKWAESYYETETLDNGMVIRGGILIDGSTCIGDVEVPDGVTRILPEAFLKQEEWLPSEITSIKLPDSIRILDDYALYGCRNLTKIELPSKLEHMGTIIPGWYTGGIMGGAALDMETLTLPETLESHSSCMMEAGMAGIQRLIVPGTMETIPDGACYGGGACVPGVNGEIIIFSEGVEIIGDSAMAGSDVKKVYLPKTLQSIGEAAFADTELTDIYYAGTEEDWQEVMVDSTGFWFFHNARFFDADIHFEASPEDVQPDTIKKGDINLDGVVSVCDVIYMQRYLLTQISHYDMEEPRAQLTAGDMDENKTVDTFDLTYLKRTLLQS